MGNIDKKIINTIYTNAINSIESLQHIYSKIEVPTLKIRIRNRINEYSKIVETIEKDYNVVSVDKIANKYNKFMFTPQISINQSKKNINALAQYVGNEYLDDRIKKITNMYISNENKNIQEMERYL